MSNNIDKIIDNLYIGNYCAAQDDNLLTQYNIQTIINCTQRPNRTGLDVTYMHLSMNDPPSKQDINFVNVNFSQIANFIFNEIHKNGNNVLIHCIMGAQRSATIVAIYLMLIHNFNIDSAIKFIKSKRPICFFGNVNYLESLQYVQNQII